MQRTRDNAQDRSPIVSEPPVTPIRLSASSLNLQFVPFTLVNPAVTGSKPARVGLLRAVDLAVLPFYYVVEFGFFFVVAVLRCRSIRKSGKSVSREELACWTLLVASLLVGPSSNPLRCGGQGVTARDSAVNGQ